MPRKRLEYLESLKKNLSIEGMGAGEKSFSKATEARICMSVGEAFMKGCFRFGFGGIMAFTGTHYIRLLKEDLEFTVKKCLMDSRVGEIYVVNSISVITRHVVLILTTKPYTPQKHLVSFENLVLNLDTLETYEHSEIFETNIHMSYNYDPKATCFRFDNFLIEVLPSADSTRVLQEFCGAFFVDRRKYKIENMCFLIGSGRNGKGVFSAAIKHAIGKDNYVSFEVADLLKDQRNVAEADGKLANICDDMSKGDISGGKYKNIVSGDDTPARRNYENPFTASNLPLIMASVNEMPVTTDHTLGHHRRNLPIYFKVTISQARMDTELQYKMEVEVSGIFNWILAGRQRFIANNGRFSECWEMEEAKNKLKVESNSVFQYLTFKNYFPTAGGPFERGFINTSAFYEDYRRWCRDEGKNFMFERTNFSKLIKAEGYQAAHRSDGNGYYYFAPIAGIPEEEAVKRRIEEERMGLKPVIPAKEEVEEEEDDFWNVNKGGKELPF